MNHGHKSTRFTLLWGWLLRSAVGALLLGAGVRVQASGVAGEYLTDVWNADDGMPDSSVTAIAQTPDGYLWVGTYNGLARFDGIRFVTFDPENTPALLHARVEKLFVDEQGTLWIGTFDGSMTSMKRGKFALEWDGSDGGVEPDMELVSSKSNQVTFSMALGSIRRRSLANAPGAGWEDLSPTSRSTRPLCLGDGEGSIWYRGSDRWLWRIRGEHFEVLPLDSGLTGTRINSMLTDPLGHLWVSTEKEIAEWNGSRFQSFTPTNAPWPADVALLSVAADGGWWAESGGSVRSAKDRSWLAEAALQKPLVPTDMTRTRAREDHHGGVWVYGYGQGLSHLSADGQQRDFSQQEGFPGDRVTCFFEDREGNWWAGLDPGGLVRICARRFRTVDMGRAISTKPARSVAQAADGTIWIGTLGDGLARWQAGNYTNFTVPGGTGNGFAFCVCPDARGRLWISAGDQDLYVQENTDLRRIPNMHGVKVILADKAGGIWVGTKVGLYFSNGEKPGNFKRYEDFGLHDVRALAEDDHGGLWVGAGDGTLFHLTTNTIVQYHTTDTRETQAIWSLLADDDGTVWAGTFRGGLLRLRNGKFTRFSSREGLADNIICQILPDTEGNLWLGSHQGVLRVARSALNNFASGKGKSVPCTVYGRSDGLPSVECSGGFQPAAWRAQDGRLWFTTVKGAVSVNPEEIRPNLLPPPVVMEEVLVDGKRLETTGKPSEKAVPGGLIYDRYQRILEVPPGKHQFEFHYTGLNLASAEQVLFRYRLEGADPDWVEAGTRRSVQYDLLPPGTYKFQVIACNSDRVWNETGAALVLKIPYLFYETLWFRVLAWILASALTAGAVWYAVTRRLHVKMESLSRQQAIERERARIAKDIHDDLGANLTLIAMLGGLARQEKAGPRIEKMESTARQAVKSLDEIVWAVNPRNDTLAHLIDYMGQFAADYLRAAEIRCRLDVTEPVPPREVPSNVRHNVFLAVKEALQNIVKHSQATEVWLRLRATHQGLRIAVEDNGLGFDHAPDNALADGLRNMHQRMKEINGECRIESRVGAGTEVVLELPWGPE